MASCCNLAYGSHGICFTLWAGNEENLSTNKKTFRFHYKKPVATRHYFLFVNVYQCDVRKADSLPDNSLDCLSVVRF